MQYVTLDSVSKKIDYGLTASATERNTGIKFLRITDIQDDVVNWDTVPFCNCSNKEAQQYQLEKGDILFARTGATTGKSYLIDKFPNGTVFASYLIRVKPKINKLDPIFLSYFFRTSDYWGQIMGSAVGAAQIGFNATKLKELVIPLPPLDQQKRIAAILSKADRLHRLRRYARELSDGYLQAVFVEMFGEPVSNPRGFPIALFGEVCDTRLGKMLDAKQQTGKNKRLYLRNENVQWGRIDISDIYEMDFDEREREILRLRKGDVLICEGGEVGRAAIWNDELPECYYQKALHRARPDPRLATPEFILWLMWCLVQFGGLGDFTSQVTIAHLTGVKLKAIEFPLPPLSLQQKFAQIVQKTERLRAQQREAERQGEHLFQALLHGAFGGRFNCEL